MIDKKKMKKYGDIGTPQRHARGELKTVMVDGQPRTRVSNKSPLDNYYNRNQIDIVQFSAGEMLYNYYVKGVVGFQNREIKERLDSSSRSIEMTESQVHARQQYYKGVIACAQHKTVIKRVVIEENPLTKRGMGGQQIKKLKASLCQALDNIAKAYGLA